MINLENASKALKEQKGLRLQSVLAIVTRVGTIGIGFLLSLFLGRTLGTAGSGQFFKVFALITFLAILAKLGLDRTILRFASSYWAVEDWSKLKGLKQFATCTVATWSGLGSLLVFILAPQIAEFLLNDSALTPLVQIGSLALVTLGLVQNGAEALKGIEQVQIGLFYSSGLVQSLFLLLSALAIWWLWPESTHSLELVMAAYSLAVVIAALVVFFTWHRKTKAVLKKADADQTEKADWQKSAKAMFWSSIFQQAMNWVPVFVLGYLASDSEVGLFEMAKRAAQLTAFFLIATNSVLGPRISTLYSKGELAAIGPICQKVTGLVVLLSLPVFLAYFLFPGALMGLFGNGFTEGRQLLVVLTIGQLVNVVMGPVGFILMMTGRELKMRNIIATSFGVLVVALIIGVGSHGAYGAAMALTGALIFQNLAAAWSVWREFQIITLPLVGSWKRKGNR